MHSRDRPPARVLLVERDVRSEEVTEHAIAVRSDPDKPDPEREALDWNLEGQQVRDSTRQGPSERIRARLQVDIPRRHRYGITVELDHRVCFHLDGPAQHLDW